MALNECLTSANDKKNVLNIQRYMFDNDKESTQNRKVAVMAKNRQI